MDTPSPNSAIMILLSCSDCGTELGEFDTKKDLKKYVEEHSDFGDLEFDEDDGVEMASVSCAVCFKYSGDACGDACGNSPYEDD